MNKNYKLIDKQINELKDLIELKQFLNKEFDNQHNTKEKETFLDYLELDYLFNKKVRFEADKIKLDQLKTNFFNHFYLQAKHKIEFIEKWIIEKRKETLEKQPEPKFNEKIPTKNLDEFKGKCEAIYWNLKFNNKDKSKMFEIINENSNDLYLSSYLAVQEIKRLHHSEIKSKAKYYLDYIKKYENDTNEFLNDLITKSILVGFDLNQFNIDVFRHFNFFIDEVERFTGLSETPQPEQKLKENLPDFLEILKEAEEDEKKANKEEKTIFFIEYQKTPLELFNEVNELSNWIIEREYCNWCTINECIDVDFDFINKLFRIVLSENILTPLSEINKIENQRNELINFINILQSSINTMDETKHDFFYFFKKYCQPFVNKVEMRFKFKELKPQPTTNDEIDIKTQHDKIEHPFSSKTNFELFKYLDEWFKPRGKKAKYTYIFNHFKDNDFEPLLSQNTYLEFVMSFKNIKIADRLQGAPSNKIDAEINRLVSEFKKSNS